jgi:hypothetical protein
MNNQIIVLKLSLIVIFIGCLFDMPYGYFQFVRFFGMVGFIILSISEHKNNLRNNKYLLIWIISAILVNPFIKIALGRMIWNIVDLIWVIILIISLISDRKNKKTAYNSGLK